MAANGYNPRGASKFFIDIVNSTAPRPIAGAVARAGGLGG